jgi:hypothetical protein
MKKNLLKIMTTVTLLCSVAVPSITHATLGATLLAGFAYKNTGGDPVALLVIPGVFMFSIGVASEFVNYRGWAFGVALVLEDKGYISNAQGEILKNLDVSEQEYLITELQNVETEDELKLLLEDVL